VLLNCKTGKEMLANFNDDQLMLVEPALDLVYWTKHFKSKSADVAMVKEICKESGIE
jgi:hypothetical protein